MSRFSFFIFFIGCRNNEKNIPSEEGAIVSVDTGADNTEEDSEIDTVNDSEEESEETSEIDTANDSEEESDDDPNEAIDTSVDASVFKLTSGIWDLADATTSSDPCGWNYHLANNFGLDFTTFLPSSFNVDAEDGLFRIKAIDYGARDNITCTIDEQDFSCTLQTVDAQQVTSTEDGNGWPRYWIYEISFEGTIIDEDNLSGVASVEFPVVNPGDAFSLGTAGMDNTECGQSFELTLVKR